MEEGSKDGDYDHDVNDDSFFIEFQKQIIFRMWYNSVNSGVLMKSRVSACCHNITFFLALPEKHKCPECSENYKFEVFHPSLLIESFRGK